MNEIKKSPIDSLGYDFIDSRYLPEGKDEYYLRFLQKGKDARYRQLTAYEIEVLVRNRNTSSNWNDILVSDAFTPELVQNCKFFGLVRIGRLDPYYLEFHNLRRPVGLYNSTIISCDLGDNICVDNTNYLSHYIVGNDVMIVNTNELATTDYAKFGNGILKEGESESVRIWMEVCNENGGRSIIPFNGMLPGDAWLWSRFRDDQPLQDRFKEFTERIFDHRRGYYGQIGDRTVIKNCKIIKDVWIGSDAYLKGANKIKNVTINSSAKAKSQIGEGCELVNGIVGYGCRIFYGVKAVRFVMASHSQLKYGARLINSYLGNNATISCCEVLNSLIFPAHEQHHNNSFLCAALVMGQSNMAAGATIGSNHNSRSPDGEIIAGRGFWPGLCVSLKHNSRFASFSILAKGDYPAELDIPLPFSLISNDASKDELVVMPAYWFLHNMYALARNSWKYPDRDRRIDKTQLLEFDFMAPDTVNEIVDALTLLQRFTAKAYTRLAAKPKKYTDEELLSLGRQLLEGPAGEVDPMEILADGFENGDRKVRIVKVHQAYHLFKELITWYAASQLTAYIRANSIGSYEALQESLPASFPLAQWVNAGGQLIRASELQKLIQQIRNGKIKEWRQVHQFYIAQGGNYSKDKLYHALAALKQVHGINLRRAGKTALKDVLQKSVETKEWMTRGIYNSRAKDYTNPFRQMVYSSLEEMNVVVGSLQDNGFIRQEKAALRAYKKETEAIVQKFRL
ncbi:DUF4954 family protein [Flavitalea sp. BT771]|uniref:DUF4954 family protein n=1 Tax=Flavitalea sp. BT771 TaxID=3063329 RepID=UPI0026E1B8A4|nr:DUF4954 family protein [Flavitalea sp. BT771]MDO6429821.1 DUF4954 family protein [Flavitalea sp. BT771]MDV6218051.1 DUF4954 family protein [Flavitalea sp. BT771]